jgi:hypothetical protein
VSFDIGKARYDWVILELCKMIGCSTLGRGYGTSVTSTRM